MTRAGCATCGRTFASVTGFDRHRRGGACVDPATLGMHLDGRGVWRAAPNPNFRTAASDDAPDPRSDTP